MVTLRDISRDTGISVTQISRALGGHSDVKTTTRNLIVEAAERLGYRPNVVARGLKTGRSGIVAMILPSAVDASAQEIVFEIVMGISAEFSRQCLKFVLYVCQPDEKAADAHEELFRRGGIDGFVIVLPVRNDPRVASLAKLDIPYVVHGRDPVRDHPGVDVDNFAIGLAMGNHLASLGHHDIVFLNGPEELYFAGERVRGLQSALAKAGLPPAAVTFAEMTVARGRQAALTALAQEPRPTAIIAGNTMLALGIYDAAAKLGLNIPDELSVLAHDDGLRNYDPDQFTPALCVTRSFLSTAWVHIAQRLDGAIRNGPGSVGLTEVPFTFSVGNSTAPSKK